MCYARAHNKSRTVTRPVFITSRNFLRDKFRLVLFLYFLKSQSGVNKNLHQKHLPNVWQNQNTTHAHARTRPWVYTSIRTNIWLWFETFTRESNPLSFSPPTHYYIYNARAGKVFTANIIYSLVSGFKSRLRVSTELVNEEYAAYCSFLKLIK